VLQLVVVVGKEAKVLLSYIHFRVSAKSALLFSSFPATRERIFVDLLLAVTNQTNSYFIAPGSLTSACGCRT
jgi:hypothetical protein